MDQLYNSFIAIQEAFRQSQALVLAGAGKKASSFKQDSSPVTETDTAVEEFIFGYMRTDFPDLTVLGEEGGYDAADLPETCWLIDPIDGTKSFIKNIKAFTGMAVLIHEGAALYSVIYDYSTGDMYTAISGRGSFRNDEIISLQDMPMPKRICCKDSIANKIAQIFEPAGFEIESAPSGAGFGFMQVVNGVSAGRFHLHSGTHIHDHAPGALLVKEAGGAIIPILDSKYSFRTHSFVACHPSAASTVQKYISQLQDIEDPIQKTL